MCSLSNRHTSTVSMGIDNLYTYTHSNYVRIAPVHTPLKMQASKLVGVQRRSKPIAIYREQRLRQANAKQPNPIKGSYREDQNRGSQVTDH